MEFSSSSMNPPEYCCQLPVEPPPCLWDPEPGIPDATTFTRRSSGTVLVSQVSQSLSLPSQLLLPLPREEDALTWKVLVGSTLQLVSLKSGLLWPPWDKPSWWPSSPAVSLTDLTEDTIENPMPMRLLKHCKTHGAGRISVLLPSWVVMRTHAHTSRGAGRAQHSQLLQTDPRS